MQTSTQLWQRCGFSCSARCFCVQRLLLVLGLATFTLTACKTNDFKVVEALRNGMTKSEARSTIHAYGFERKELVIRPPSGWATIQAFMDLPKRALDTEKRMGVIIASAEYYPCNHGLMGWGELFLFYDAKDVLVSFYCVNIN